MEENDDDDGDRPERVDVCTMTAFQRGSSRLLFEANEMRRHPWQQRETSMTSSDPSDDGALAAAWPNWIKSPAMAPRWRLLGQSYQEIVGMVREAGLDPAKPMRRLIAVTKAFVDAAEIETEIFAGVDQQARLDQYFLVRR